MEWKKLLSQKRLGEKILDEKVAEERYPRSEVEKDYHRIVSSSSFRRLQDKTQVFPLEISDFVRTRLTHSIEVSSHAKTLGSRCVKIIREKESEEQCENIDIIPDVLMCAGLLHDIGNPPFGHFGEDVIRVWFEKNLKDDNEILCHIKNLDDHLKGKNDFLKFEGNAQAFRVLTKLHFTDSLKGMNLTSAVLNTLVKYPTGSEDVDDESKILQKKKMGFFKIDKENFDKVTRNTGTKNNDDNTYMRHPLTYFLEAADDIAYITADLEDGFKKGLFTVDELRSFFEFKIDEYEVQKKFRKKQMKKYTKELLIDLLHTDNIPEGCDKELFAMRRWLTHVSSRFSYCAAYGFYNNYSEIMNGTFDKDLIYGTFHHDSIKILRKAMEEFIFSNTQILKLELAAETILSSLLNKFVPAVVAKCKINDKREPTKAEEKLCSILSDNYVQNYKREVEGKDKKDRLYSALLLVTDYISGMTDSFAKHLYKELNGLY